MCCVHNRGEFLGGYLPWVLDTWVLGYPPKQLSVGKQWSQLVKLSLNCCRWKAYPIWGCWLSAMLQILIFSFWRKLRCKSSKCISAAAKIIAWDQHLFLHFLFTYTYLFSLNIMSSNLLSACNKDDKLRDHQQLTFEFFGRICLLIYPPSHSLLNRQRFPFQNFFDFFFIKCKNTKPFFFAINNSSLFNFTP